MSAYPLLAERLLARLASMENGDSERAELRLLIGIKTPPQRLADAEADRQITGEGTSGDSFIKF